MRAQSGSPAGHETTSRRHALRRLHALIAVIKGVSQWRGACNQGITQIMWIVRVALNRPYTSADAQRFARHGHRRHAGVLSFASVFAPGSRVDIYLPYPLTEEASRRGNELAM